MQNSSNGDTPPPIDAAEFSTLILQMTRNNHKLHGVAGYQWMHFLTQQLVKLDGHFRGDGHTYNGGDVKQAGVVELHTIALLLADMHFQAMYESVWTCLETAGVTHLPNSAQECRRHAARPAPPLHAPLSPPCMPQAQSPSGHVSIEYSAICGSSRDYSEGRHGCVAHASKQQEQFETEAATGPALVWPRRCSRSKGSVCGGSPLMCLVYYSYARLAEKQS